MALKIRSPQIVHKTEVGGVILDLVGAASVRAAAEAMAERVARERPEATVDGFLVEEMIQRPDSFELIVGISVDATFGPVVMFGQGGVAVEVVADTALALPPLDLELARALVERTRIARLLHGFRGRPPVDLDAVCQLLINVAQLAIDHREIVELDINPFLADASGVIALDARIRMGDAATAVPMAILPYPHALETDIPIRDGTHVRLRPIRPDDADGLVRMHHRLAPEDIRARFHGMMRDLEPALLARLTQIDYDREMALIAFADGDADPLGVVRINADPDNASAEFAIVVRSDWHGRGLGTSMISAIIAHARQRGIGSLIGSVLGDNRPMLTLMRELGFDATHAGMNEMTVRLDLTGEPRLP